nr:hypothetical protein [Tanacetum cinerariifolium]
MSTLTFVKTHSIIAYLEKPTECDRFEQIIDFLNGSSVKYALTVRPTIHTSCIKQFWTMAKVKKVDDKVWIQALVDGKRFMIYTILQCLSAKTTSWNEFSSTMASAIICLATNQKINFSRYILLSLVKNIKAGVPFFMFPRFVQLVINHQLGDMTHQKEIFDTPLLTKKDFANMKRVGGTGFSGEVTPLFSNMLVQGPKEVGILQADTQSIPIPTEPSSSKPQKKHKPKRKHTKEPEKAQAEAYNLDLDHKEKVLSMLDVNDEEPADVEEVLEVVTTAKLITKVVTTGKDDVTAASVEVQLKDKGKAILIAEPKPLKRQVQIKLDKEVARHLEAELNANVDWNAVIEQVQKREKLTDAVMNYQALKRKPLTEVQARRNMIVYLKNLAGYKIKYFKGITYDEIRPLFKKHYNYNQAFLNEVNKQVKVLEREVRQEKEVKVESSKREGKSLEKEIPIIDYKIHTERNRTYVKIIRADGNHRERFAKTEPKNYSYDYLLSTLKIMFEKPNVEANIFLLVERMYPLTHFTLEQMINDFRLEVKDESKMSLEILRLVRRQLNEG